MATSIKVKLDRYYKELSKDCDIPIEEVPGFLDEEWGEFGHLGLGFFVSDETNGLHIQRIDEMDIFDGDWEAADYAEDKLGVKLIPINQIKNEYPYNCMRFIDSEENRKILIEEKVLKEKYYERI